VSSLRRLGLHMSGRTLKAEVCGRVIYYNHVSKSRKEQSLHLRRFLLRVRVENDTVNDIYDFYADDKMSCGLLT